MTKESEFVEACVQTLLKNNPEITSYESAFRWLCKNGDLRVAQWLLQIKPTINISANNEKAFRWSCENGHLHVAQWLLQIKPTINISADNEEAFRWSCENGHLHVAQWLQSLMPFKYVIKSIIRSEYDCYALTIITLLKKTGYDSFINANLLCTITNPSDSSCY